MGNDSGSHYRKYYRGIQLDPYRIADVYELTDHSLFTAMKKILAAGQRGNKNYKQDIIEARDALNRKLEMLEEDEQIETKAGEVIDVTGQDNSALGIYYEELMNREL